MEIYIPAIGSWEVQGEGPHEIQRSLSSPTAEKLDC